jgi:hypothetical protein
MGSDNEHIFRAGDVVKHIPTGETWVLACSDGVTVWPCGWPETRASASDCELVKAASDKFHEEMIRKWASKDDANDERVRESKYIVQLWDDMSKSGM